MWLTNREPTIEGRTPKLNPFVNANDRHLPPSRQHPPFVLPPLSRRLEAGGRVPCQAKGTGGLPDWCFLPLAGTYAIVSKGKTLQSPNQAHHIGILGALAAWRVTQAIYRFDPSTYSAMYDDYFRGRA